MPGNMIEVKNLSVKYEQATRKSLENVSFSVKKGEVFGIIGSNGVGKSTLAMSLNHLIPMMIDAEVTGEIILNGQNIEDVPIGDLCTTIGYVFSEPENQISQLSVEEEVAFGLENIGVPHAEMTERIENALQMVGLKDFAKRNPLALSGGQQQRLAIASVLAMHTDIFVLDEPTTMLDPVGKDDVFQVLGKLKENHTTCLIIDHDTERMASYCDRIMVLCDGKVHSIGTPKEILSNVTELTKLNLRVPQVSRLTTILNERKNMQMEVPVDLEEAREIYALAGL